MKQEGQESQRGNKRFELEFCASLKHVHTETVDQGDGGLRIISKCGSKVIANKMGYLGCYSFDTQGLLWSLDKTGQSYQEKTYDDELYVLGSQEWLARYDSISGYMQWRSELSGSIESINQITDTIIYTVRRQEVGKILLARSKKDGNIRWSHESEYGSFGTILCENGILVVECSNGYYSFVEETGELLWSFDIEDWQGKYLQGVSFSSLVSLCVLIDGMMYFEFSGGYIAAIDVKTCEPRWIHQLQMADYLKERKDRVCPRALYYRNGELLFTTDQGHGHLSYLTILDAKTGEQIYQANQNFTPAGCFNGVVINQYYIDGYERYLSVFDIEKRETVWTYKHPKAIDLFTSGIIPFDNGFVAKSGSSLYWFKCNA